MSLNHMFCRIESCESLLGEVLILKNNFRGNLVLMERFQKRQYTQENFLMVGKTSFQSPTLYQMSLMVHLLIVLTPFTLTLQKRNLLIDSLEFFLMKLILLQNLRLCLVLELRSFHLNFQNLIHIRSYRLVEHRLSLLISPLIFFDQNQPKLHNYQACHKKHAIIIFTQK